MNNASGPPDPLEGIVRQWLEAAGENPDREGLAKTPERVAEAWRVLLEGQNQDPQALLTDAVFAEESDQLVCIRGIDLYSLCEHHLLPFHGKAHVAYLPAGHILGFSKIPRLVELYARRLQVQERLTRQIADTLEALIQPRGVGVVIEATHLCMSMRGVQKDNAVAVTSEMRGVFRRDAGLRSEFLSLIGSPNAG